MSENAEKTVTVRKRRTLRIFLIGAGAVIAVLTFITQARRMDELRAEKVQLEQQLLQLENTTQRLERMIKYSQTDDYIEQMAHKRLGWVKPGEILFYAESDSAGTD